MFVWVHVCMCAYSWHLPGCCSRQWALQKGGTAVTSLIPAVGAGRGYCGTGKAFHLIWGLIYARHTAWMTQKHTIHQSSRQKHLLPLFSLAVQNKRTKTGKGWVIYHNTITQRSKGMQKKQKWIKWMCQCKLYPTGSAKGGGGLSILSMMGPISIVAIHSYQA